MACAPVINAYLVSISAAIEADWLSKSQSVNSVPSASFQTLRLISKCKYG